MSPVIPWMAGHWAPIGRCPCGAVVSPDSFRDRASYREAMDNQLLCQDCQDAVFFAPSADGTLRYPIRRGVIAAPAVSDGVVREIGLLPFIFVAPEPDRIAWEARDLLRAGPNLEPLDPWDALEPMRTTFEGHQVRLTELDHVGAPEVRAALDLDLVVVLDAASDAALDCMPFQVSAPRAILSEIIHWTVFYSSGLLAPWIADESPPSVLRTCALGGLGLDPGGQVVPPLSYIVSEHRERFPELSWVPPDVS